MAARFALAAILVYVWLASGCLMGYGVYYSPRLQAKI